MHTTLPVMVSIPQENTSYLFSFYSLLTMLNVTPLSPFSASPLPPPSPYASFSEEQQMEVQLLLTTWFIRTAPISDQHPQRSQSLKNSKFVPFSTISPYQGSCLTENLHSATPAAQLPNAPLYSQFFTEQQHPTHPKVAQDTRVSKSKSHHMHISKKHRVVKI